MNPVLGLYGPGTHMWRINREAVLLGAGPAALLLQVAHPHVAEGVAHHSNFEEDPWKRLHGTLKTTMDMVFGDVPTAERALARLNSVHRTVKGRATDPVARELAGPTYRALDPSLLLWVQATLIVTSIHAHERWVGPLAAEAKEAFWQEARRVGPRMGIPLAKSPADWPTLMAYWDRMVAPDGPVQVTPTARRLARTIVRPPIRFFRGPLIDLLVLPSIGLLPPRLREAYGLDWGQGREFLAEAIGWGLRLYLRVLPVAWRSMPHARAAWRRTRSRG
ncbi:oxygenase MpaB family protein [soil metagenome]